MRAVVHSSIAEIPKDAWDRMLPGEPEGWVYYKAAEDVGLQSFKLGALSVEENGRIIAAAPIFQVQYRIDTPLQGRLRKARQWIFEHAPRLVNLPVIGLGSPMADNCTLALAPELGQEEQCAALEAMLAKLRELAHEFKSTLIAVKSIDSRADALAPAFAAQGFTRTTSVPLVMLDLPFKSYEEYLASLPAKTRGYLKRKARAEAKVRMEYRNSIDGLEHDVFALFQSTLAHSKVDYGEFEQLTPEYFPRMLAALGDTAQFALCWHEDKLVGFQLSLVGSKRIVTKYMGMRYPEARELNLYFVNWLKMIDFAINKGIRTIDMGSTTYATKLLFGGHVSRRWLYFRFTNSIANALLSPLAPLLDYERNDPEMKALEKDRANHAETEVSR